MGPTLLILAIDTSGQSVSVALLDGPNVNAFEISTPKIPIRTSPSDQVASRENLPPGYTKKVDKGKSKSKRVFPPGASVLLAPMIKRILEENGTSIGDLGLVTLAVGPGLFTGLRVGVVTAKSLCYSAGIPLIGVNTLEVIAAKGAADLEIEKDQTIQVVLNAQRGQLFAGDYRPTGQWATEEVTSTRVVEASAWAESVEDQSYVTGSGLKTLARRKKLDELFVDKSVKILPEALWDSDAQAVGQVAFRKFESGQHDDLWTLQPFYFRPSAAEEVRQARIHSNA